MFESICIRHQSSNYKTSRLDIGLLAEAMLFYQDVHLIVDIGMLKELLIKGEPETVIELLRNEHLHIYYLEDCVGIYTKSANTPHAMHDPIIYQVDRLGLERHAPEIFMDVVGRKGRGRRLARRFIPLVEPIKHDRVIPDQVRDDINDQKYLENILTSLLQYYVPEYELPQPIIFKTSPAANGIKVDTNIDFYIANKIYHKRVPLEHSSLSEAYLLSHLMNSRANIYFASQYSTEIAIDQVSAHIMQIKVNGILGSYRRSKEQISDFQDFTFKNGHALRETINSGEKTLGDMLDLLNSARKFKKWLISQPPDGDLLKQYYLEVTSSTWVDKLPGKSLRWALFTAAGIAVDALGAGGVGTTLGLGLSAADQFILDKILKGWKPSQFIEGTLVDFISDK